jgi:4-carboxymuconolactone decarboxylase
MSNSQLSGGEDLAVTPAVPQKGKPMKSMCLGMVLVLALVCCATARAQERLGPIPVDKMTDAQKRAVEEFMKVRPNGPFGFWWGYLRVPEVMIPFLQIQSHVHGVMETEKGALGEKLTHFAILIAARQWTQQVIWNLHDKNAIKSGLKPEIMSALAAGRRPQYMAEDEEVLYDFCIELQRNQSVSDQTYARMLSKFGERGIGEATLIQGEYTIMSMFMNVARTPLDAGTPQPLMPFPR